MGNNSQPQSTHSDDTEATIRGVVEQSIAGIFIVDENRRVAYVNPRFAQMMGYASPAELVGRPLIDFISEADKPQIRESMEALLTGRVPTVESVAAILAKDGRTIDVLSQGSLAMFDGKHAIVGVAMDITQRKQMEERLQFANSMLTAAMEASPDGILAVDKHGRIISFNRRFAELWKIPVSVVEARDDAPVLAAVTAAMKEPEAFAARVQYLYAHPEEVGQDELETKDGRVLERNTAVMRTASGQHLGRVWFFRDVTSRRAAEAKILHASRHDVLTELANRRTFLEAVERAIARTKRGEKGFAVLYLDLDHFKDVNDTLGHPAGDALLRAVGERLRLNVRNMDLVARFGGDEFAVIVTGINDPADAARVAKKLITAIHKPFVIGGNTIRSSISVGIAVHRPDIVEPELLLSQADTALYRAKSDGRDGYQFFTQSLAADVRDRVTLNVELAEAIASGQLFLQYQPQVDANTGRIIGVEALVRWRHPTRGVLLPGEFIPAAEKAGFIISVDRWVMREACRQGKAWLDAGVEPIAISVNVSCAQFKRAAEFEKDIAAVLANSGLPPHLLELELTETVLMEVSLEQNDVLVRLRRSGVKLAIDDFGTGYSSLSYLRRFPVDRVKIAQEFVAQIATEPGSAAIVRATIALARELGLVVIAEGVETVDQYELLKSWGCHQMQGYHFARPLGPEFLLPLLERRDTAETGMIAARSVA